MVLAAIVFNVPDSTEQTRVGGYSLKVDNALINLDGSRLLTVDSLVDHARDGVEVHPLNAVTLRDAADGTVLAELASSVAQRTKACFSPNGARVLTIDDTTLKIWEAATGELHTTLPIRGALQCTNFTSDSTAVLAGFGTSARMWSATTGALLAVLRGHQGSVRTTTTLPTRHLLTSDEKHVHLWDPNGRHVAAFPGTERTDDLGVSVDGNRAFIQSWDARPLRVLSLRTTDWVELGTSLLRHYPNPRA
jgi:WD40 repeat protein